MQDKEIVPHAAQDAPLQPANSVNRREFMRVLSVATAGSGFVASAFAGIALTASQKSEAAEALIDKIGKVPKVKLSKRMGGIEISQVTICRDSQGELLAPSLAAGMNFIHKAGYYGKGVPEELKKLPRESYYLDTTVDSTSPGHNPDDEEAAYNQVTKELDETGFKYFDVMRAHYGWHSLKSFNHGDNASYKAFLRLKKEGKVRHYGVSQHAAPREDYETYMTMLQAQIDSGIIDSIQMWFSYETTPAELAAIEKAHKAGIMITAMKTVAHGGGKMRKDDAKMKELKADGMMGRSCLRYVLGLKGSDGKRIADTCVSALRNFDMFEENLGAVAAKVAAVDGWEAAV